MKSILAAALVVVSVQAQAVFVTQDHPGNGQKWLVTDTRTGLQWLNLHLTTWWSPMSLQDMIEAPLLSAFRLASTDEVEDLFSHVDRSFNQAFIGHRPFDGMSFEGASGYNNFYGYMPTSACPFGFTGPAFHGDDFLGIGRVCEGDQFGYLTAPGLWAVRNVSPVPEPGTWLLMLTGLYCLQLKRAVLHRSSAPSHEAVHASRIREHIT